MRYKNELSTYGNVHFEDGRRRGRLLGDAIRHNLNGFWAAVADLGIAPGDVYGAANDRIDTLPSMTIAELHGMACSTDISFKDLLAFNLFEESVLPDGCSVAIAAGTASATDETIFFKQSDKKGADEFEGDNYHQHQQINVIRVEEHDDLNNVVAVAAAGSTAVKMGINDQGVAIGSNISRTVTFDEEGKSSKDWAAASRGEYMRQGLLRGDSANGAAEHIVPLLFDDPMSSPGNIDIADTDRAIVIEGEYTHIASEWVEDDVIGRANKFEVLDDLARPESEIPSSYARYARIMEVLEENAGNVSVSTMRDLSVDHTNGPGLNSICRHEENDYTDETSLSSAIFELNGDNPEESVIYIALGKPCHAWRTDEGEGWLRLTVGVSEEDVPESFRSGDAWLEYYTEEPYVGEREVAALD